MTFALTSTGAAGAVVSARLCSAAARRWPPRCSIRPASRHSNLQSPTRPPSRPFLKPDCETIRRRWRRLGSNSLAAWLRRHRYYPSQPRCHRSSRPDCDPAPAAMATTSVKFDGAVAWRYQLLSPQPITVPSLFKARLCVPPHAMATTPVVDSMVVWNLAIVAQAPHSTTVPSFFNAMLCKSPAAMATTWVRLVGGVA